MDTSSQTWLLNIPDESPSGIYLEHELINTLYKCLNQLPDREKKVIYMKFGLNGYKRHTFKQIGKEIERTSQRAHSICVHALQSLKKMMIEEDTPKTSVIVQNYDVYKPPTSRDLEREKLELMKKQEIDRIARQQRFDDFVDNVRWHLHISICNIISDSIKLLRKRWIPTEAYDILVKLKHPCCQRRDFVLISYARVQDQVEYLSRLMRISNYYRLNESFEYADWNACCLNVCGNRHERAHEITHMFMDFKQKNVLWLNIPDWQYTEYQCGEQFKEKYNQARERFKRDFKEELQLFYTKPMFKLREEVVVPIFEKLFKRKP